MFNMQAMRDFYNSGKTQSLSFRLEKLKELQSNIELYENEIINSLNQDLAKPEFEAYTSELALVYQELNHAINNLSEWMQPELVDTPLYLQPAKSYIYKQPKGVVFIISPWNYPFQLLMIPLIGAVAAGNCALVKPSEKSPHTGAIIEKIIAETFSPNQVAVLKGKGSVVVDPVLDNFRFDHIFFTGSQAVGKHIMKRAAENLTPVTLELGGKSPALVLPDADIKTAAKRIVWGKFYNAGQTCVGVDYVLVHKSIKNKFVDACSQMIRKYYGKNNDKNISRIVDLSSFERLEAYLDSPFVKIIHHQGRNKNSLLFKPTLIEVSRLDIPVMEEEIFGPILPIISYENKQEMYEIIHKNPNPLALYIYSENKNTAHSIIEDIAFGGGAINHNIIHLINSNLPFGGFGESGMGQYHAQESFNTFTHQKSIIEAGKIDFNLMYPPYNKVKYQVAKKFMK